jgi:hypothetical protein
MGILFDIITNEHFQKRTAMFVGTQNWRDVACWLRGVEFCQDRIFPDQTRDLDGFREWLHKRFDGPGNTDWAGIIESVFGSNEEATEKAFECLDAFLKDLNLLGIDRIITDHAEYEKRRYGCLSSSRLKDNDETFYNSLIDEIESEKCKKDGCQNNRIKYSVLCRDHHFEMLRKRPAPKGK